MENRKRLEVRGKGWVMEGFRVVEGKIVFTYIRKKMEERTKYCSPTTTCYSYSSIQDLGMADRDNWLKVPETHKITPNVQHMSNIWDEGSLTYIMPIQP